MPALAEARSIQTSLLAVRGTSASWSISGAAVSGVHRLSDWTGEEPLDVAAQLGAAQPPDAEARVVVVEAGQVRLPLLAHGTLSLLQTTPEHLLVLPALFQQASPLVDRVALLDGAPALFVLSPARLLEVWLRPKQAETASPPSSSR
ncbi:MAG TPA: hypothetical protein VJN18_23740 [Polyangiaceae bacterium]|nr:hypothetical protein [Polyangiaceae bacterium]